MKPPVEHVKVSAKGRDILIKVKRNTGLEYWNEVCRIAFCRSLANPNPPPARSRGVDSNIDMDWKVFAGQYQELYAASFIIRAGRDGIDIANQESVADYFRNILERGILSLRETKNINDLLKKTIR
jgi:DNA sulfur modification protein DndE